MTHAERAGDRHMQSRILSYLARAAMTGPRPVTEGVERCTGILERAGDDVVLTAVTETMLGMLEAMRGDFSLARSYADAARRRLAAVGLTVTVAVLQMYSGWIELMAESPERAVPAVQDAFDLLDRVGEGQRRAMTAAMLSRLLLLRGLRGMRALPRDQREERFARRRCGAGRLARDTRAVARGHRGPSRGTATRRQRSRVALATRTPLVESCRYTTALGEDDAVAGDLRDARALFERKGVTSSLDAIRRSFESFAPAGQAGAPRTPAPAARTVPSADRSRRRPPLHSRCRPDPAGPRCRGR